MIKQLKPFLKNLANEIRNQTHTTEKINAQDFPLWISVVYTTGHDDGYQSGYTSGYDEGEDLGYTNGFNDGLLECEQSHEEIKTESFAEGQQAEYDRFWNDFQQNGKRTDYRNALGGISWNDENFRPKYDITIYNGYQTFAYTNIVDLAQTLENAGVTMSEYAITNAQYMFWLSTKINRVPVIRLVAGTSAASTAYGIFDSCSNLKTVDKIILESDTQSSAFWSYSFNGCRALENIVFEGVISSKIAFSQSTKLSKDSITSIVNALSTTTSGLTVSLSKTAVNNAFSINVDDETTYPEGSEYYTLRHSKDNWTFSYV